MAAKLKLIPGSKVRWGARRFDVVDYVGLDAVIAREVGKRIRFAGGKLRKANLDLWVTRNTGVVTNSAYLFDSPKKVVVGEVLNRIAGVSHWNVFHSQIAPFYSHLILGYPPRFANNFRIRLPRRECCRLPLPIRPRQSEAVDCAGPDAHGAWRRPCADGVLESTT